MTTSNSTFPVSGISELTHLGVIRAVGEDAVKFLQGQLTQDVASLGLAEARLAAFCNAKGRMQASFVVFKRSPEEILLVCSRDILAATLKRLSMFVMRAKVKLSDASAEFQLYGLAGEPLEVLAAGAQPAWTKTDIGEANLVFLSAGAGQSRALWCAPAGSLAPQGTPMALELWHWLTVQSGIAMISQPSFEAFVPQMLNYESVGGVNFKKGCYPGQEIVARTQYLGKVKRHLFRLSSQHPLQAGDPLYSPENMDQTIGTVMSVAAAPGGGFAALGVVQSNHADNVHLESREGPQIQAVAVNP